MDSLIFIECITLLECFLFLEFCISIEYNSLVITEKNGNFRLTRPFLNEYDFSKQQNKAYFEVPENGNTYHFCPNSQKPLKKALFQIKMVEPNSTTEDFDQCSEPVTAIFAKVENPEQLKEGWDNEEMELYHSGFLLSTRDLGIKNIEGLRNDDVITIETEPMYDYDWNPNYYKLFPQIEVYYKHNMEIQQTVAVKYTLLSTTISFQTKFFSPFFYIKLNEPGSRKTPVIFLNPSNRDIFGEMNNDAKILIWKQYPENRPFTTTFASIYHFSLPVWEQATIFELNLISLWKKSIKNWESVEKFALMVAKKFGDIEVSAGITGIMTILGEDVRDYSGFKIPNYFWKVFEYRDEDYEDYGIIVVLNCNTFEKTEKICETINCRANGWLISNNNFQTGEIYCCEMTKDNITNLKADYLSLKNKAVFNINKWEKKKLDIFTDIVKSL